MLAPRGACPPLLGLFGTKNFSLETHLGQNWLPPGQTRARILNMTHAKPRQTFWWRGREVSNNYYYIIALFAFIFGCFIMKHQRIQNHLSRSAHLQMSQIENIFTNFSYNQNIPQKYKISFNALKSSRQSQNEKKCAQPWLKQAANYRIWGKMTTYSVWKSQNFERKHKTRIYYECHTHAHLLFSWNSVETSKQICIIWLI